MNLLMVIVKGQEKVEDFLSVLIELDVAGLQVLDSSSVMEVLAHEAPIFAGLRQLMIRPQAESKTIIGLTEHDILPELERLVKKIGLDLNEPGTGYAFLLPIEKFIGYLDFDSE